MSDKVTVVGGQLIVANTEKTYEVYDMTEMYKMTKLTR